jgi:Tol biopolymer transport system component
MREKANIWIGTLILIIAVSVSAQTADKLFQEGLMKETAEGNLREAINIYKEVVKDENAAESVKAKAQLHIGLCYEKLGNREAIKAYELVVENYKKFEDEVQIASLRLLELNKAEERDLVIVKLFEEGKSIENATLSPDGTKLAGIDFTPGQNIVMYDRNSKKKILITEFDWTTPGHGWTYYPVWSPDGKEIAYEFGSFNTLSREIRITGIDGGTRTLIKNDHKVAQLFPRQWSQDGESILAIKQDTAGTYTIGILKVNGGSFIALHKTQWKGRFPDGDASFSPDGRYVAYSDGEVNKHDIFIIDSKDGTKSVLTDHPTHEREPIWSHDGRHIAFIRETKGEAMLFGVEMSNGRPVGMPFVIKEGVKNVDVINWTKQGIGYNLTLAFRDIYTVPLDPETGVPIEKPKPLDYTPTGSNTCPVWSHDGKYLAFVDYSTVPELVILSAGGEDSQRFDIPAPDFWSASIYDLRWLPDNTGIGFCNVNSMEESIVYRLTIATGDWLIWKLPGNEKGWNRTEWGPDANTVVYNRKSMPNRGLYMLNIKTGESQNIFEVKDSSWYTIRAIKFSRDHSKLSFMFQDNTDYYDLILVDLDKGETRVIGKNLGGPTFSPDGEKIIAWDNSGLSVLSLEGEILQQFSLLDHFTPGTRLHNIDWAPGSDQFVFSTDKWEMQSYLMKNVLK